MGRKIPSANNDPSQAFSIPLFLAGMAAMIAIASILCGARSRRKSESPTSTTDKAPENKTNSPLSSPPTPAPTQTPEIEAAAAVIDIVETSPSEPKKAPGKQIKDTFSTTSLLSKSASTRNLAKNLSMKMTRSMSMAGKDLQDRMKKGKLKPEESVWMKTIILGEKCKVTDGEEAIIYERKGNKIAAYHPKTSNTALIEPNPIRAQNGEEPKDFSG